MIDRERPGYRGLVLAMLLAVYTFNFLDRQILGILAKPIQQDLGLNDAQFGAIGGIAFALLYSCLGVPLALLADRIGKTKVIAASLIVWSGFTTLCGMAGNFWHLFLYRLGVGVGEAGGVAPSYALIADYYPIERRARALAIYSMGIPIGLACGVLLGAYIAALVNWRVAFLTVGLAGIVLAAVQVSTPAALVDTAYGRLLLAKLSLLTVLFALAALNRWRLTLPVEAGDAAARKKLVRSIGLEVLVVLAVFGVAAGWRFTPPPRALAIAAAQPATTHIHTAKAMADLVVAPGRAGPVAASIVIMTGDFGPLDAKEVTLVLSKPDSGIGPLKRPAHKPGDGTWRVDDLVVPVPGRWTARLDILVSDFDMIEIEGPVDIRP